MWFVPMTISYLTYVRSKWIGDGPMSLEASWICISGHEDVLLVFVFSLKLEFMSLSLECGLCLELCVLAFDL